MNNTIAVEAIALGANRRAAASTDSNFPLADSSFVTTPELHATLALQRPRSGIGWHQRPSVCYAHDDAGASERELSAARLRGRADRIRMAAVRIALAMLVLSSSWILFYEAPVYQFTDSQAVLLVSQSLVDSGNISVERYVFDPPDSRPGTLWVTPHGIYHYTPPGTALLSAPAVWILDQFGLSCVRRDGVTYSIAGDIAVQRNIAASLMAMTCLVIFATARRFLSIPAALLVVLVSALGTPIMSTASRGLWAHTWGLFLLATALWLLVRGLGRPSPGRQVLLASLLSWAFFCRPIFAISIVGMAAYLVWTYRRGLLPFAATGAVWLFALFGFCLHYYHRLLPPYVQLFSDRLGNASVFRGMLGHLLSPSRGLLVHVPILCLVPIVLWNRRSYLIDRRLVVVGLLVCAVHIVVVSAVEPIWWAGHAFGPRYMTDVLPWFVLLGIQAAAAESLHLRAPSRGARHPITLAAAAIILGAASLFVNLRGAWSEATWAWNGMLGDSDRSVAALWDWSHPQFLAGLAVTGRTRVRR
jgi:hypothetical protein